MRLLILGGTVFLGRHIVEAALKAGHKVTTLNRGTNKHLHPKEVETFYADRTQDLNILSGHKFDAVIDTSAYSPDVIERSISTLKKSVGTYLFVSSVSVYRQFPKTGMTETDDIGRSTNTEEQDYGSLKADCEKTLLEHMPHNALIIRPGLIVGPHDPTDRFSYWPVRIAKGGTILAPGRRERQVQFIDVRDLAEWMIRLLEHEQKGTYNAKGPQKTFTMANLLSTCAENVGPNNCEFKWVDDDLLTTAKIQPWTELPLWIPESDQNFKGFMSFNTQKAYAAGLVTRPLADTIIDTLQWRNTNKEPLKTGLSSEKEAELLKK